MQFDPSAIQHTMATLERQRAERADYLFPAARLSYTDGGQLVLSAQKTFRVGTDVFTEWQDAEKAADLNGSRVQVENTPAELPLTGHAAGQLASTLGIPQVFIKNLREKKYSDLLGHNFRELLARDSRRFLVRTLPDGKGQRQVRALLSDRYRCLDNYDLFFAAADVAAEEVEGKPRAQVWKCRMSDDGGQFEMFLFSPHIYGEVRLDRPFDPGDGWMSRWHGQSGDGHNAACRVGNSETGTGRLVANLSCLRKICANFCVWTEGVATVHLGKANEDDGLILSDETRQEANRVIWLKVKDLIRSAFDPEKFQRIIDRLNGITQQEIGDPQRAVDQIVSAYQVSEDRKALILGHLLGSGDRSRFGLVQAVTATCHDLDRRGETEPASQLEELGAKLVDMPDNAFSALVRA